MKPEHMHFQQVVWQYYTRSGRHTLPWRTRIDPYRIAVSECMLQQTQVTRVIPKFCNFLQQFPSTKKLALSPLSAVLRSWQGLGYNRRAKYLHQAAQMVHTQYYGRWPTTPAQLAELPGIGPYTAGAIAAFAHNYPSVLVETNIRTAVIHHFFPTERDVTDVNIMEIVQVTLPVDRPREWYWALMDYGSFLKQTEGNNIQQAATYRTQRPFQGSSRQLRGILLRLATQHVVVAVNEVVDQGYTVDEVVRHVRMLEQEGLLSTVETGFQLAA